MDPPPIPSRPFDLEMRRRLRFGLALLDMQTSFDRATKLIVPLSWVESLPTNANDEDFDIGLESPTPQADGFTDMTYALLVCKAQRVLRRIDPTTNTVLAHDARQQQYTDEFSREVALLIRHCDSNNTPFHWYTKQVAIWIVAQMQLLAVRPLHHHPKQSPAPIGFNLLQVSVEILQRSQTLVQDARGQQWRWYERIFNPWHILSVAIAELCVCDDIATIERYWETVEWAYLHYKDLMTGSPEEAPWGPMERLMRKARAKRSSLYLQTNRPRSTTAPTGFSIGTTTPAISPKSSSNQFVPLTDDFISSFLTVQNDTISPPLQTQSTVVPPEPEGASLGPSTTSLQTLGSSATCPGPVVSWAEFEPYNSPGINLNIASMDTSWANWESFLNDFH
jgi:hypothetical protein